MPSSRYDLIPLVLNIVTSQNPSSILDIGIGYGKYGAFFYDSEAEKPMSLVGIVKLLNDYDKMEDVE